MEVLLAQPRGFCAGVSRAIEIVELALEKYGSPVYVRHEIVHNKYVVDDLRNKGAIFVKEISEIPNKAVTIFSAHGVSQKVEDNAELKQLLILDATCPLVTKVHNEAIRFDDKNKELVIIGHRNHPEVEGTTGRVGQDVTIISDEAEALAFSPKNADNIAYVTQTTLSVSDTRKVIDILKQRFPSISGPDLRDICYATQNRQDAVIAMVDKIDLLLVVGAKNSSNSNRLRDLGEEHGVKSYLIDTVDDINPEWLDSCNIVGVTAGASAPEILVEQVLDYFNQKLNAKISILDGVIEKTKFKLPNNL